MASSALSPSSEGSLSQAEEKVRLRVSYGGTFVLVRPSGRPGILPRPGGPAAAVRETLAGRQANGQWRLAGAESYLESVSPACTYADLCWRLGEKHGAASIRYVLPGEKLDPDSLITVADDQDVQARQPRPRGASASDCRPFGGALRAPRLLAAPAGRASPTPAARAGDVRGVLPRAQGAGHAGQDIPAARGAVPGRGGADDA